MTLRRFVGTPRSGTCKNVKHREKYRKNEKKKRWNWMNSETVCLSKRERYGWMLFLMWKIVIRIRPQNELQIVAESCMTSIEESTCVLWASPLIVLTGERYAVGRKCFEIVSILSIHTMVQCLCYFYRHTSAGGCEQNTVSIGVARLGSTSQP